MSTLNTRKIKHDSSSVDNITLDANGRVGIGTSSPTNPLDVVGNDGILVRRNGQTNGFIFRPTATGDGCRFSLEGTGDRMIIDSDGRVTMPYQPAFQVRLSGNQTISTAYQRTKIAFDTIDYENGSNYSTANRRFTAPVTGFYQFNCWTYAYTVQNNELLLYKNGSIYLRSQWASTTNINNVNAHLSVATKLTAGDYVEMFASFNTSGDLYHSGDRPTVWSGFLIG